MSPTTPTTGNQHGCGSSEHKLMRLPIGSAPGQNRFASASLTTMFGAAEVGGGEQAAFDERNAHRREVAEAGVARLCDWPRAGYRERAGLRRENAKRSEARWRGEGR